MTAWSSRSIFTCVLLLAACTGGAKPTGPGDSSADSSSSGPGPSTTPTDTDLPDPDTTAGSSSGPGTSSSGPGDTSTDTTGPGPDDTTGSSSGDPSTSDSSSSGDPSTGTGSSSGDPSTGSSSSGDPSSGSSSSGDPTTGSMIDCSGGDGPDFIVGNSGAMHYVIDGVNDPGITVVRGCSYTFTINAPGHPFLIKTAQVTGVGSQYNDGVTNNGTQNGVITWDVPAGAPDTLYYICQLHAAMTGTITVIDP